MHFFTQYNGVIFDLDNTIIRETDYLFYQYDKISKAVCAKDKRRLAVDIFTFLKDRFENYGRSNLFQLMLNHFGIKDFTVEMCLDILRGDATNLKLEIFDGTRQILKLLNQKSIPIGILTNGNPKQQELKVRSVNWANLKPYTDFIIYADQIKRKPAKDALEYLICKMNLQDLKVLFIGDSEVDKQCADAAGIDFFDINSYSQ
jgi:HAD superfamily hydrolase (TIGR01549 family)